VLHHLGLRDGLLALYEFAFSFTAEDRISIESGSSTEVILRFSDDSVKAKSEAEILEDVLSVMTEDGVFLDVGANFGRYSCTVGRWFPTAEVVPIEPNPAVVDTLRDNLSKNAVNTEVYEYALSDYSGKAQLQVSDEPARTRLTEEDGDNTVRTIRGDQLFSDHQIDVPTVVKIDVEGAEVAAIRGLENTLSDPDCQYLYCETHPFLFEQNGETEDELTERLHDFGFETDVLAERTVSYEGETEVQNFIKAEKK